MSELANFRLVSALSRRAAIYFWGKLSQKRASGNPGLGQAFHLHRQCCGRFTYGFVDATQNRAIQPGIMR